MNCNRYEYEMSMSLDGRLPSGRRESLMTHIDACTACAGLWEEMRHAQDLTLSLPPQQVGSEFQDTLWDRIRAGEGSPEAVFNEPVPIAAKARYLLTGAAAAALVILAVNLFDRDEEGIRTNGDTQLAKNGEANTPTQPAISVAPSGVASGLAQNINDNITGGQPLFSEHQNTAQPLSRSLRDFTPHNVAELGAQRCATRVDELQKRIRPIESRLASTSVQQVNAELRNPLIELRNSTALMSWLQRDRIIQLPADAVVQIQRIEEGILDIQTAKNLDDLRTALHSVRKIRTEPLRSKFFVKCCEEPTEFFGKYKAFFSVNPRAGRVLDIKIVQPTISHQSMQIFLYAPQGTQSRSVFTLKAEVDVDVKAGEGTQRKVIIQSFETRSSPQPKRR